MERGEKERGEGEGGGRGGRERGGRERERLHAQEIGFHIIASSLFDELPPSAICFVIKASAN